MSSIAAGHSKETHRRSFNGLGTGSLAFDRQIRMGKDWNLQGSAWIHLSSISPSSDPHYSIVEIGLEPSWYPQSKILHPCLMHKKEKTGDNLSKRGIYGPHWCSLCYKSQETMEQLFVDCSFSQEVWDCILQGLNVSTPFQVTLVTLFSTWRM